MNLPEWAVQLCEEWRFRLLVSQASGEEFQHLFQQIKRLAGNDEFLDVRPLGSHGDFKCDGWDLGSNTCYAAYGPFTRKTLAKVKSKLRRDFEGAAKGWPEMRAWRVVHNDYAGLSPLIAKALVELAEEAKLSAPNVRILAPMGPQDVWWLLRDVPAAGRQSILGTHGWAPDQDKVDQFVGDPDDPVSEAAGRSVAQLIDNFPAKGLVDPIAAAVLARVLMVFFLGDSATRKAQADLFHERCYVDPPTTCLTAVVFAALAAEEWTSATGESRASWVDMMSETGIIDRSIADLVLAAVEGRVTEGIPDDPFLQEAIAVDLCPATTITLQLAADARRETVITALQDLLIAVQRLRAGPPDEEWLAARRRPRSLDT